MDERIKRTPIISFMGAVIIVTHLSCVLGNRTCTDLTNGAYQTRNENSGCVTISACIIYNSQILVRWKIPQSSYMLKYEVTLINKEDNNLSCSLTVLHKGKNDTYQRIIQYAWNSTEIVVDISVLFNNSLRLNTTAECKSDVHSENTQRNTTLNGEKRELNKCKSDMHQKYTRKTPTLNGGKTEHSGEQKPLMKITIGLVCGVLVMLISIIVIVVKLRRSRSHKKANGKSMTLSDIQNNSNEQDIFNHPSRDNTGHGSTTYNMGNDLPSNGHNICNGEGIYNHLSRDYSEIGSQKESACADYCEVDIYSYADPCI